MGAKLKINNATMRKLWLNTTGLAASPTGTLDVPSTIKELGFVQLDTIQNVARAHHHILWSRNQNYREHLLDEYLAAQETIFEHFTHDASVLPMDFYPLWTRQFRRLKKWLDGTKRYKEILAVADLDHIRNRIENEGPLSTHSFDTKVSGDKKMWSRPPHKIALDYMWYAGELATSHRENFKKFYDLSHRVIPKHIKEQTFSDHEQVSWLCDNALSRLGFGTLTEIRKFWDAVDKPEVEYWLNDSKHQLVPILWQTRDGDWIDAYSPADIEERLDNLKQPSSRLRIINPFDPAVRDRNRLNKLFGFDYKIEIFVPANKRQWGYYVYPILMGQRFIGRIELKADRKKGDLNVINFWQEDKTKWTDNTYAKLDAELGRFARLAGLSTINWPNK